MSHRLLIYTALSVFAVASGCSKEEDISQTDVYEEEVSPDVQAAAEASNATSSDAQAVAEVTKKLATGELKLDVNLSEVNRKDVADEAYKADLEARRKAEIQEVNKAIRVYEVKKAILEKAKRNNASKERIADLERECEKLKANWERLEAQRQAKMAAIIRERRLKAEANAKSEAYKKLLEQEKAKKAAE